MLSVSVMLSQQIKDSFTVCKGPATGYTIFFNVEKKVEEVDHVPKGEGEEGGGGEEQSTCTDQSICIFTLKAVCIVLLMKYG